MTELDLSYLHSRKIILPAYEHVRLMLVGCGGTGSFMARGVATVARLLMEKFQKTVEIVFIDPDTVEEKNCYRQNFCPAEIGRNKAETLAFRYSLAWGVQIVAIPEKLDGRHLCLNSFHNSLMVVIGCVDNAAARTTIAGRMRGAGTRAWWIDCGNHQSSGQVLIGAGGERPGNAFDLPGFCSWLPLPSAIHPELLESEPESPGQADATQMSCADLAMLDSQGLAINQAVASEATDYLVRLLLTRDLQKRATYINLAAGSARSTYITKE